MTNVANLKQMHDFSLTKKSNPVSMQHHFEAYVQNPTLFNSHNDRELFFILVTYRMLKSQHSVWCFPLSNTETWIQLN